MDSLVKRHLQNLAAALCGDTAWEQYARVSLDAGLIATDRPLRDEGGHDRRFAVSEAGRAYWEANASPEHKRLVQTVLAMPEGYRHRFTPSPHGYRLHIPDENPTETGTARGPSMGSAGYRAFFLELTQKEIREGKLSVAAKLLAIAAGFEHLIEIGQTMPHPSAFDEALLPMIDLELDDQGHPPLFREHRAKLRAAG